MLTAYNIAIEHRFFVYAALAALPLLFISPQQRPMTGLRAALSERTNLTLIGLLLSYCAFHYLWGHPWHIGWQQLGGGVGLALFALFAAVVGRRFFALYRNAVEGPGTRNWPGIKQMAVLLLASVVLYQGVKNLLVGKSYATSRHRLAIALPIGSGSSSGFSSGSSADSGFAVLSGGYLATNNPDYDVPAKRFAIHIAGQPTATALDVVAPCAGEIKKVFVQDSGARSLAELLSAPDSNRYGSSIALKCYGFTSILLLSNLDPDSISVKVGASVALGAPLAKTGHSEYRQRGGLLIHAVESPELSRQALFVDGEGVVITIAGSYPVKGEVIAAPR